MRRYYIMFAATIAVVIAILFIFNAHPDDAKKRDQPPISDTEPPTPSLDQPTSPERVTDKMPAVSLPAIRPDHIVIVVEENHALSQIVGNAHAPYFQSLVKKGALFTDAHAITHPSQPNYIAMFSGSTQGVKNDACKKPFTAPNLASELIKTGYTFTGYSEDLPKTGFTGCYYNKYARKHNPWAQFANVPAKVNKPLSDFPERFELLPTVSFVIPNLNNDMHDGSVQQADSWLMKNLDSYVAWAEKHNSLLLITWDEDDFSKNNRIPMLFVGPMVKSGKFKETINHYHVLRTIEDMYRLPPLGQSSKVQPITSMWKETKQNQSKS